MLRKRGKVSIMKTSFHSFANKINFLMKSVALSLAFMRRFNSEMVRITLRIMGKYNSRHFFSVLWLNSIGIGQLRTLCDGLDTL